MDNHKLRKLIREHIISELSAMTDDGIMDSLSDISLSIIDIQKKLADNNPELADELMVAQHAIQNVQNKLS